MVLAAVSVWFSNLGMWLLMVTDAFSVWSRSFGRCSSSCVVSRSVLVKMLGRCWSAFSTRAFTWSLISLSIQPKAQRTTVATSRQVHLNIDRASIKVSVSESNAIGQRGAMLVSARTVRSAGRGMLTRDRLCHPLADQVGDEDREVELARHGLHHCD